MKKSIFLSVLALAAVVSCQKSEIVDSKYGNDEIGFESYVGRDAQTKATPYGSDVLPDAIGVYGFYLGTTTNWSDESKANLWVNESFAKPASGDWTTTNKKYWTNGTDKYTFFAYAPYATNGTLTKGDGSLVAPTTANIANPALVYNVPTALADQVDLIYSNNLKPTWKDNTNATALTFNHALSRFNVYAAENEASDFTFTIKKIYVKGNFYTKGTFNLGNGDWDTSAAANYTVAQDKEYILYEGSHVVTTASKNFSTEANYGYFMTIPTSQTITLYVDYTITYANQTSAVNTKYFTFTEGCEKGTAYAANLLFMLDQSNEIKFSVDVTNWSEPTPTNFYPEAAPVQQ